jgi:uncharacterized protein YecE (DUF72 family)
MRAGETMQLYVGTSGFSYKEWRGSFYPADLPAGEMLRYYGERLPAVEINNTFYRLPSEGVLVAWAEQVPAGFRFALKATQRITHLKRLKGAESETEVLLRKASELGQRLGPILFQLPPNLKLDLPRLAAFLQLLPRGAQAAFELRHPSWSEPGVHELLRAHGCALCTADVDDPPPPKPPAARNADHPRDAADPVASPDAPPFSGKAIEATADWGYLRLRRQEYDDNALQAWSDGIAAQPWTAAYVFFKHEDAGAGPRLAARFLASSRP